MQINLGILPTLLVVTFITLKLCGVIAWSWLWVLSPVWIPFVIVAAILTLAGVIAVLSTIFEK